MLTACGSPEPQKEPTSGLGLRITRAEETSPIEAGATTDIKLFWTSNRPPKAPLTHMTRVIKCPGTCLDFGDREIPINVQPDITTFTCAISGGKKGQELILGYQLADANGEKSNIVEQTFDCLPQNK